MHQLAALRGPAQLAQLERHWQALSLEEWLDASMHPILCNAGVFIMFFFKVFLYP